MKKIKKWKIILVIVMLLITTGCTTTLTDKDKNPVKNPETGQSLTENILCQPTDKDTIKIYEENGVEIKDLPQCDEFKVTSGGYEGLWTSIFVKPLAFVILWLGKYINSYGLSLIIISLLIRLVAYPVTRKTALQSELIKKAKPDIDRIEKKYENKTDTDSMMKKSQEMTLVYKKYKISPLSGCLYAFLQLPLFIAFLEAINRVPAIFEEKMLLLQLGTTPMVGFGTSTWYMYIILVLAIGSSTYFSFKLNATTASNEMGMKQMPIIMTGMIILMGLFMPAALGLYWITTNLFTIVQNIIVKRSKLVNE